MFDSVHIINVFLYHVYLFQQLFLRLLDSVMVHLHLLDEKVVQLVKAEHEKARKILSENREKLDELAMYLYEKETITGDEFMDILDRK